VKKKILATLLMAGLSVSLVACGNNATTESAEAETTEVAEVAETTETAEAEETDSEENTSTGTSAATEPYSEEPYTALDYVTLGDYSSFEVELNLKDYTVSDSDLNSYIDEMIEKAGAYADDPEADTVLEDSVIRADYVGKLDGVAFDGGTASDSIIDVANNSEAVQGYSYIEGFTNGLAGAKVGEEVDVAVTFPEDYSAEDLAGKDVVFTFTINAIEKKYTHENIDDAYVLSNFSYNTVDAYKVAASSTLRENNENTKQSDVSKKCLEQLLETTEISDFPEGMIDSRFEKSYANMEQAVLAYYSMTVEEYAAYTGKTLDEYKDYLREQIESSAKKEMVLKAIAETENFDVDQGGYVAYVQNLLSIYDYDSDEYLYSNYSRDYVEYSYLLKKAEKALYANTTIVEK